MGEVDDRADVAAASWAAVRWGAGGSGGVGEEEMGLGAREVGAFFALTAICGGKGGSSGEGGNEMELGAGAGEEWSGVQKVGVGGCCGVTSREGECTGVGEAAVVRLGGDQVGRGGVCGWGYRRRSSSSPTPLSSFTSQRLFAAFLVRFAGGGEGAGEVSGGDGLGQGGSAGGGSGWI